ncbi:MAG: hypothetical protein MUE40_13790 [Anaerolineae bacterium]|jgi:DNA-binding response OmpR family regulator|nr:hypothetical protein [Anaerolineae bacterium]
MITVLIVTRRQDVRAPMMQALAQQGCRPVYAGTPQQALALLHSGDITPQIILCEMDSNGQQVYDLWVTLREDARWQPVPLLFLPPLPTDAAFSASAVAESIQQRLRWSDALKQPPDLY